jgi:hypothetical protein
MTLKDNVISTGIELGAILVPALAINHVFLLVMLAAFFGMMFGFWNANADTPLDSETDAPFPSELMNEFKPGSCSVPPNGWFCTGDEGHEGPCAAVPGEKQQ